MVITTEKISKKYLRGKKEFLAAAPTDLHFGHGKLTVILGKSGSGKTTLLNMLAGLLEPSEGNIIYDDTDIYSLSDEELSRFRNKNIGYVPQGMSAIKSLTVLENILLPTTIYSDDDKEAETLRILEDFGLLELKDAFPDELSGGELRRMAIARALVGSPSAIFADEPTNDLDNENAQYVFKLLKDISRNGTIVIVVTHDHTGLGYADTVYEMNCGSLTKKN